MTQWMLALALCTACGGQLAGSDGGLDAGDASSADAPGEITYDGCSGSDGIKLCGGTCGLNGCPIPATCGAMDPNLILGVCIDDKYGRSYGDCDGIGFVAKDGTVCVPPEIHDPATAPSGQYAMGRLTSADPGYAIMYAKNGFGSFCHYADRSTYDGTPVPDAPSSCPAISGFQLCGGSCGACPKGQNCTGRSPLHPYSLCVTDYTTALEQAGESCVRGGPLAGNCQGNAQTPPSACLTFKVSDADQPFADLNGICMDRSLCLAAAAGYPGGAYCTP